MDSERYDLYFGSLKVGAVTRTDSDFPNLWGTIIYDPALSESQTPSIARFARFVALNKESTRLADMEDEQDSSVAQAAVSAELESGYQDYVESEQWRLVDARGRESAILCPNLRWDGEIVWRWDPRRA